MKHDAVHVVCGRAPCMSTGLHPVPWKGVSNLSPAGCSQQAPDLGSGTGLPLSGQFRGAAHALLKGFSVLLQANQHGFCWLKLVLLLVQRHHWPLGSSLQTSPAARSPSAQGGGDEVRLNRIKVPWPGSAFQPWHKGEFCLNMGCSS